MQPAPKDLRKNLIFRRELLNACSSSTGDELRNEVIARCSQDPIFFFDAMCWTLSPKDSPEHPDIPFILYPAQEVAVKKLDDAIGKHELLFEKSRDVGATWFITTGLLRRWLFMPKQLFLLASRKQEYVDKTGDHKCLFAKLDYQLAMLPAWMKPPGELIVRNALHIGNLVNGSCFDGESTNCDLGRGDRRTAIMLDEFAAVENGEEVLSATRDATRCRLFVSTPKGAAGAFYDMRQKMMQHNPERVVRVHWSELPTKNPGLYYYPPDGELQILDKNYKFPPNYEFVRQEFPPYLASPWFDEECRKTPSKTEIAAELCISYDNSLGGPLIRQELLTPLIARCAEPLLVGELQFEGLAETQKFVSDRELDKSGGRLRLWVPLDVRGRPPESDYVVCADPAGGSGTKHSNSSVISIADKKTKQKVARFKSNDILPHDLGIYAVALCKFFHNAQLCWETNGIGGAFKKAAVVEMRYRNLWMKDTATDRTLDAATSSDPGWHNTPDKKKVLLLDYTRALVEGRMFNPSIDGLKEISEYIYLPNGTIEHQKVAADKSASKNKDHGDEVIADALAWKLIDDGAGRIDEQERERFKSYPVGSFGYRREQWLKKQREVKYY